MKEKIKKNKKLISFIVLLIMLIGASYAYLQAQIGGRSTANVTLTTGTTDTLTFTKGDNVTLGPANTTNFAEGGNNLSGSTTVTASLRASGETATESYNVYLKITNNDFIYTTAPTNTPELILSITDPSGNPVTSLTGLTYTTVNGVSGFDVTTATGLIQIVSNREISVTSSANNPKNEIWTLTLTYVNLDTDQADNITATMDAQAIIQKDEIDPNIYAVVTNNKVSTYNANVSCSKTSTASWSPMSRALDIYSVSAVPTTCTVTDRTNTNTGTLKSIVEGAATEETYETASNTYTVVPQNGYSLKYTPFYYNSWSTSRTSGTAESNSLAWNSTNTAYLSNPSRTRNYYYYLFSVAEAGNYQLCYKKYSGGNSNRLYRYKNTTNMYTSNYITASSTSEVCLDYGSVTTSDTIRVGQYTSSSVARLYIYLKKTSTTTNPAGYRYEGENPNNYVWFNNELWRIIGSIPTKISSTNTSNLVKIIRNNEIGGLVWHTATTRPNWNSSSLYTLLNSNYYGKVNANSSSYCYGYQATAKAKCDYREMGISSDSQDYYGSMIENVYWNTGTTANTSTASAAYVSEIATQSYQARIGLMSASDYGYAASYGRAALNTYNNANYTGSNWLYGKGDEYFLTPSTTANNILYASSAGNVASGVNYNGYSVRPVVYLKAAVYVVSGDGSESNPYKLAQ